MQIDTRVDTGRGVVSRASTLALVAALSFGAGMLMPGDARTSLVERIPLIGDGLDATPDESVDLSEFWKVWNALDGRFVPVNASTTLPSAKQRLWGALEGLAASYGDPYTVFLPPEDAKVFAENVNGNFEGVGMEIGSRDGRLTVVTPLKNTPAERAGILAGDVILAIDDVPAEALSADEAVKLIRGPGGTRVRLALERGGSRLDLEVVRERIDIPTIDTSFDSATGVFSIALYSFTGQSVSLFDEALARFRASGARRLLIDLRGNPGGYLEAANAIASRFLPHGTLVVTEDYGGRKENVVHRSVGQGGFPGTRIAVLIDRGSASASEILAGALRDHGVATLVGERTFGKGSVQELIEIGDASLKVSVARWLTPSGVSIADGGVTPDIEVERSAEDRNAGRDPQRARAVLFLTTGR